jgi:protein gp37
MHNWKLSIEHREICAGNFPAALHKEHAYAPRRRKKSAVICAQFMGDLGQVHTVLRAHVLDIMRLCPWHTFLVLTKWPENITEEVPDNCWMGTTITDQATADLRIPELLKVQARHKWVSVEPMLGPVDITKWLGDVLVKGWTGKGSNLPGPLKAAIESLPDIPPLHGVQFVACGPETGTGARACDHNWINDVCYQCYKAGVTFYDKREIAVHICDRVWGGREWPAEWKKGA